LVLNGDVAKLGGQQLIPLCFSAGGSRCNSNNHR
jgi:hypothetical protein